MEEMERADELRAREEREMIEVKMERVREAERQRDEPLDDSQLVDEIFQFLPPDSASEAQAPPLRFQVKGDLMERGCTYENLLIFVNNPTL